MEFSLFFSSRKIENAKTYTKLQLLGIQTTMSHFYCDAPKSHCDSSWCWLEPWAFPEL
jgi:hypothetical protein